MMASRATNVTRPVNTMAMARRAVVSEDLYESGELDDDALDALPAIKDKDVTLVLTIDTLDVCCDWLKAGRAIDEDTVEVTVKCD